MLPLSVPQLRYLYNGDCDTCGSYLRCVGRASESAYVRHLELCLAQNGCPVHVSCCHTHINVERVSDCKLVKNRNSLLGGWLVSTFLLEISTVIEWM